VGRHGPALKLYGRIARPVRRKEAGEKLESLEGTRVYGFCFDLENGS
jgi:hypothetical protein